MARAFDTPDVADLSHVLSGLWQIRHEADDGDAIDLVVGLAFELFTEDIRIEFAIGPVSMNPREQPMRLSPELINAGDDRRAGIEHEAASWLEPRKRFAHDAQSEINSQSAAS